MVQNTAVPAVPAASNTLSIPTVAVVTGQTTNPFDVILKATPPALLAFLTSLPAVEGNFYIFYSSKIQSSSFVVDKVVVMYFLSLWLVYFPFPI